MRLSKYVKYLSPPRGFSVMFVISFRLRNLLYFNYLNTQLAQLLMHKRIVPGA